MSESHSQWEMRMIRERGWIYFQPRRVALWRRLMRWIYDSVHPDPMAHARVPEQPQDTENHHD